MSMKEHWDNIIPDGEHLISSLPEVVQEELKDVKVNQSIPSRGAPRFITGVWFQPTADYIITKISENKVIVEGYTHVQDFGDCSNDSSGE